MITTTEAALQPLQTDADILDRVRELVGPAQHRTLWPLLLQDGVQLPMLIPIDDVRSRPDADGAAALGAIVELARAVEADGVVLVLERPGEAQPSADDLAWATAATRAFVAAPTRLRAVVLATSTDVAMLDPSHGVS